MKAVLSRFLLLVFTFLVSFNIALGFDDEEEEFGSSSSKPSPQGQVVYSQTNIWYEKPMKVLPIFHKGVMIPAGTKVTLGDIGSSAFKFTREDGMQFRIYTKYYRMSGQEMAELLFDKNNPMAKDGKFHKFNKMERQAIKQGKIVKGMSREAAIMAYGYPPRHVNPMLEADNWQLWKNRWDKMNIYFQNGKVSNIHD